MYNSCSTARWRCGLLSFLASVAIAGCSDSNSLVTQGKERTSRVSPSSINSVLVPHRELTRLMALALQNEDRREALRQAILSSPVSEGKLHLLTYLTGDAGSPLLLEMASRGGVTQAQVITLIAAQERPLEFYMPVPAHRAAWVGDADVVVAIQRNEEEVPFGIHVVAGSEFPLNVETPPNTPTLALVPSESFDDAGRPYEPDLLRCETPDCEPILPPPPPPPPPAWNGLWINEVHVTADYESWTKGSPEFEMQIENAQITPRTLIRCADEDKSVEPYRWNMDGLNYYDDFLLANRSEMPKDVDLVIAMWEDDDTRCVVKTEKDFVLQAVDFFFNVNGTYKALQEKKEDNGNSFMQILRALAKIKSIIKSNDEFVGIVVGTLNASTTPRTFYLKSEGGASRGSIVIQLK